MGNVNNWIMLALTNTHIVKLLANVKIASELYVIISILTCIDLCCLCNFLNHIYGFYFLRKLAISLERPDRWTRM